MAQFLLGGSGEQGERDRVADRLAADPEYFEAMSAFEDDLILRWHHRQLSAADAALFEKAYLASPPRRERVDAALALLEAAQAWQAKERASFWNRAAEWLSPPWGVLRLEWAAAAAMVTVAAAGGIYFAADAARRARAAEQEVAALRQQLASVQRVVVAVTLAPLGSRGQGRPQGTTRVRIPRDASEVRLALEVDPPKGEERFEADLSAVDRDAVTALGPQRVERTDDGAFVTVAVAATALRVDGDYFVRLRSVAGGGSRVVATRMFRVAHR
jgi:hypothetical protein